MSWECPHCGTTATLQNVDVKRGKSTAVIHTAKDDEGIYLSWSAIKCPSKTCGKFVLDLGAYFGKIHKYDSGGRSDGVDADPMRPVGIGDFRFEPRVGAPLSAHAPKSVIEDYSEACLIKDLSPKAAATLCRRALQGMVRDFWGVNKRTLADELQAIEGQCDEALFKAMTGLRSIGNIGAHPERNIDLIIDVEEGEVESLLGLLHILDREWYVARAARATRLAAVVALGASKAALKIAPTAGDSATRAA